MSDEQAIERDELTSILRERCDQDFDGECHLTNAEADRIITFLATPPVTGEVGEMTPFELQGPDENGHAWICSPKGEAEAWCHNLGPWEPAAELMSQWLGERDYEEIEARRLVGVKRTVIGGRDE